MNKKPLPTRLSYTQYEIKDYITKPIINSYKDGLKTDELKSLTDADKYYYHDKNFKIHKNKIKNNILGCRDRCSKITGEYDVSFDFEACKKGCHIESPYYCSKCPNNDMYGKMFYFDDKNKPFKGNCSKSGNKKDCEKGKVYFRDLWDGKKNYGYCQRHKGKTGYTWMTNGKKKYWKYKVKATGTCDSGSVENCHKWAGCFCSQPKNNCDKWRNSKSYSEQPMYEMSNKKLHRNECLGANKFYKDTACDKEISLKDRYSKLLNSYKDYQTEDKGTYNNIIQNIVNLRNKNNKKTSSNNIRMDSLIKKYKKLQEGMGTFKDLSRQGRLEDNKLLVESEMYKKIGISILGITLLLITAKKLNNL